MAYGDGPLESGDKGPEVVELQMRLAGFLGTVPDGDFGPKTADQVRAFQHDYMKMAAPSGIADLATLAAIAAFGAKYPVSFAQLACPCGTCGGFGKGLHKGDYWQTPHLEMYHRYEYPGVHKMSLWTYRAAQFYAEAKGWKLRINSGYRCTVDNLNHKRTSTNHLGKAVDMDIVGLAGKADEEACDELRAILQQRANAQIRWLKANTKAMEPGTVGQATNWVHIDVRTYDAKYLDDRYFVKTAAALDAAPA